jgi:hypothetical protein
VKEQYLVRGKLGWSVFLLWKVRGDFAAEKWVTTENVYIVKLISLVFTCL